MSEHRDGPEDAPAYEPPRVDDLDDCQGTVETGSMFQPVSQLD